MRGPSQKAREQLAEMNLSIAEWSRRNGFSPALVARVLSQERRGKRGVSREIAVRLGLVEDNYKGGVLMSKTK